MSKNNKEDRVAWLNAASEQKKKETLAATEKAIHKLQAEGKTINFNAVAREAKVSTSYLYKYPELKYKITKLREEQRRSKKRVIPTASDNSKNRIIGNLKRQIQDLQQDISGLRKANESLAGRAFELEEYEETVNRFRDLNQKLSAEIERLADENTQLKDRLARHNLAPKKKVTSIKSKGRQKRTRVPIPDSIKKELKDLGIKINSTLRTLIRANPEEVVLEAIEALKYALDNQNVPNPGGWLNTAIKNRWKQPIESKEEEKSELDFPEGFEEWYVRAIDCGFVVNESPTELPKNIRGEILVKVNKKTASGLPHSLISWKEAEKMMKIEDN